MTVYNVQNPFSVFVDSKGDALENGYIWIGVANLNPQTNPISVYWDEALTLPAPQPIRTLDGYIVNNGTPANIYVDRNYSIQVLNKKGIILYSKAEVNIFQDASNIQYSLGTPGSSTSTVANKLGERISVTDFGAVGDGVTDDTIAIQIAITTCCLFKKKLFFPAGVYIVTAPLNYSGFLSIYGEGLFTNAVVDAPTVINCFGVNGYLFTQPDVIDGSGALHIECISFDGRQSGTNSTTWSGLVQTSGTPGLNSFYLFMDKVLVGGSDVTTSILSLRGEVFARIENCFFATWYNGIGISSGESSGVLATTITLNKCYFNSFRQCYYFSGNVTDVTFNDCVFESSIVCGASARTFTTFNNCYFENIGADTSGGGRTTGLTARSFGIADAPPIAGDVVAGHTVRYGQIVLNGCTCQPLVGGKYFIDGIGRGSGLGSGGIAVISDLNAYGGAINIFQPDVDSPSSRENFEYRFTGQSPGLLVINYADARMISDGKAYINWSDSNIRQVNVKNGQFIVEPLRVAGFTSIPTIWPSSGQNNIGDIIYKAVTSQDPGTELSWVCTNPGTSGAKWNTNSFTPVSVSGFIANGNSITIPVTLSSIGTMYEYHVMCSQTASLVSNSLAIMLCHLPSGSDFSVNVISGTNVSVAYVHGGDIVVTNSTGASLYMYARLVSVGIAN